MAIEKLHNHTNKIQILKVMKVFSMKFVPIYLLCQRKIRIRSLNYQKNLMKKFQIIYKTTI